jgi:hypothetical protein
MAKHRDQHIIPKVYLKYFSKSEDGKGIAVLHYSHPYKKRIETKDSGDKVFVKKNFYDTAQLADRKQIELFMANHIEPNYHRIIESVRSRSCVNDYNWKIRMMEWMIYSKMRSPMWRELLREELRSKGHDFLFDSNELREEHMQMFHDENILGFLLDYYGKNLSSKKWSVLKSPEYKSWLTSDNPGFSINVDEYDKENIELLPNAYWTNISHDTVLYFPLSSEYCLRIQPYNQGDDVSLNISNTPVQFELCTENEYRLVCSWIFYTHHSLLICSNREDLRIFEEIKNSA